MGVNAIFLKYRLLPFRCIQTNALKPRKFSSFVPLHSNKLFQMRKISNSTSWQSQNSVLFYSSSSGQEQLLVKTFGDPQDVVVKENFSLPKTLGKNEVIVNVLASPVNPADINTIQGVYAIKPDFPFVPGNEAVMQVVDKGSDVIRLGIGDRVIPALNAMGTWRTAMVAEQDKLIKIPSDIDIITASTIAVNPCTAYRMLTDFVDLKPGDVVIQNCANSAVGQAVIQIAAVKGIQTVNIVRQRPNFEELKEYLTSIGATSVILDSELRSMKEKLKGLPKPVLALNGVSGKPGTDLMRQLADGGTMVTYGGMSRQPVTVPVGSLIFNDVILRGFWMTRWNKVHESDEERFGMLDALFELSRRGKLLCPPHERVPFHEFKKALEKAMPAGGMAGKKQVLVMA
ncbi:UNVERIFIED_CONTAM: hypothetical protein GTU68_036887 [Idotea baltica]|nr:hypothetical protein [Idotea baltica]